MSFNEMDLDAFMLCGILDPMAWMMMKRMSNSVKERNETPQETLNIDVSAKKKILIETTKKLKAKYIGIDKVIDQIIKSIELWYCYPQYQTRPLIINLIGLTGVGKTSLIKDLARCLELNDKFCNIELDNNFRLRNWGGINSNAKADILSRLLEFQIKPSDQSILLLDEIHRFRTVIIENDERKYIPSQHYKDIWKLLSDGSLYDEQFILTWIKNNIYGLEESLQRTEFRIMENSKLSFDDKIKSMMGMELSHDDSDNGEAAKAFNLQQSAYKNDFIKGSWNRINSMDLSNYLSLADADYDLIKQLRYTYQPEVATLFDMKQGFSEKIFDKDQIIDNSSNKVILEFLKIKHKELLSKQKGKIDIESGDDNSKYIYNKMLIFIAGNYEDLYTRGHETITITDVITSLEDFFRLEQISRFGKNYIIYPILTEENFKEIILKEMIRKENAIKEEYHIDIRFDKNDIWETIKKRGVNLNAGTRPLFSALNQIFSELIPGMLIQKLEDDKIEVKIDDDGNAEIVPKDGE